MTLEEILRLLVGSPRLHAKQIRAINAALLSGAERYESMDWGQQSFFKEAYDAALRLQVTRLLSGQDVVGGAGLFELVREAPFQQLSDTQRLEWLTEKIAPEASSSTSSSSVEIRLALLAAATSANLKCMWLKAQTLDNDGLDKFTEMLKSMGKGFAEKEAG